MDYTILQWVGMAAVCGLVGAVSLSWIFGGLSFRARGESDDRFVILFHGAEAFSITRAASSILSDGGSADDWSRLRANLIDRFPTFPDLETAADMTGSTVIEGGHEKEPFTIVIEQLGDVTRVEILPKDQPEGAVGASTFHMHQLEDQVQTLFDISDCAPNPIWKTNHSGQVSWHNKAYGDLFHDVHGKPPSAESPLFAHEVGLYDANRPIRLQIDHDKRTDPAWYDVTSIKTGEMYLHYAQDVSAVVRAETTQRNYVQTLAKTFAQLSIGLAIFDRNMQLILFNPALVDLTELPADFLTARPNMLTFFDRLRDGHVMPEPKNYSTWRDQMSSMVAAANDGDYHEVWDLPSGSTYRVTGRPHPDGAVAFLFEDVSAQVLLNRQFRTERKLSQAVFDEFDDAIAVFSGGGHMILSNQAYRDLWHLGADSGLTPLSVVESMQIWQSVGGPNVAWGELRDFIFDREHRETWSTHITLPDARHFVCSVHPIQSGATLVRFISERNMATQIAASFA